MSVLSAHSDEFRIITAAAQRELEFAASSGILGIGDDAAFVPLSTAGCVVAMDTLLEGVHFDRAASPEQIGHKAIAVNLSDFAAMAAVPKAATVAISVCRERARTWIDRLMAGLQRTAHDYDVAVVGGDTTSWTHPLAISVTVVGEQGPAGLITRSNGRPGDRLYVTGPLGGSIAGHHLTFQPRVAEAIELARRFQIHAMLDVSDGLASDLRHLTAASRCGAVIDLDRIPRRSRNISIAQALCDGEDFELLVAAAPDCELNAFEGIQEIGVLTDEAQLRFRMNGDDVDASELLGYSHDLGNSQ